MYISATFHFAETKFSISRSAQLTLFSTLNSFGFNREMESPSVNRSRDESTTILWTGKWSAVLPITMYCCTVILAVLHCLYNNKVCRPTTAAQVCCDEHICAFGCVAQCANCTSSQSNYQGQKLDNLLQEELIQTRCL